MSKMDEAQQRLQRALSGLEAAVGMRVSTAESVAETATTDGVAPAAAEAELERLRKLNADLGKRTEEASARLDGAIGRIREILKD
ncbi:MAG: hypothetical protein WD470_05135 [Rhodospirillaceae bacterium]